MCIAVCVCEHVCVCECVREGRVNLLRVQVKKCVNVCVCACEAPHRGLTTLCLLYTPHPVFIHLHFFKG